MAEFFSRTGAGEPGLALFLNAGDPPLPELADVVRALDEWGVDCLELAVPFPDSVTDGSVIRRSSRRALAEGVTSSDVLDFVADIRGELDRLRIALLVDWAHTVRARSLRPLLTEIRRSGADGLLVHGVPPRARAQYYAVAEEVGPPLVTSCYHAVSSQQVLAEAAAHASAYLYLVARYGRTGAGSGSSGAGASSAPATPLADTVTALRARTDLPIAVGFGVRTPAEVYEVTAQGADAVVVGSAAVERVERAVTAGTDVVSELGPFVRSLRSAG